MLEGVKNSKNNAVFVGLTPLLFLLTFGIIEAEQQTREITPTNKATNHTRFSSNFAAVSAP